MYELLISHDNQVYIPAVLEKITLTSHRIGSPAKLSFSVVIDDIEFFEGDAVSFRVNSCDVFFGFIFTLSRDKNNIVNITAYDQLRYFKNKDTYVYQGKKACDVLAMLASDFNCQLGVVEDTGYVIPHRIEENSTLFDIVQNALDLTVQNTGQLFVLYDDFGKLCLKNIYSLMIGLIIDQDVAQDFSYSSSIDKNSFNKVKLVYENSKTGTRNVFIAFDNNNINSWGVLQYYDTLKDGENGVAKAISLMDLYDKKTRKLTIENAFGDINVRAGCLIPVKLDLGNFNLQHFMLVESVVHTFYSNSYQKRNSSLGVDNSLTLGSHFMKLTLSGGEFSE